MLEGFWYICNIVAQEGSTFFTEYQNAVLYCTLYSTGYWYSGIYEPKILPPPYSIITSDPFSYLLGTLIIGEFDLTTDVESEGCEVKFEKINKILLFFFAI